MNRTEIEFHRAQSRLNSNPLRPWRERLAASLFPRRTGATYVPVAYEQALTLQATNDDRIAAYEQRKADLMAEAEARVDRWRKEEDRFFRVRRKVMKRVAANRLMDRRAA